MASTSPKGRNYKLNKRAEHFLETHERIAVAAWELHQTVGPRSATYSAIAERAGVERLTVYRHFPTQKAIFGACTVHGWKADPAPDPARWSDESDPSLRLHRALAEVYAYFRRNQGLLANVVRDMPSMPIVRWGYERFRGPRMREIRRVVLSAWPEPHSDLLEAAVGHALEFTTWQSLVVKQNVTQAVAVHAMVIFVSSTASAKPPDARKRLRRKG